MKVISAGFSPSASPEIETSRERGTFIPDSGVFLARQGRMVQYGRNSPVGVHSIGYYIPKDRISSEEIAGISGIPLSVLTDKFGIYEKHVAGPDEDPWSMAEQAAWQAIKNGNIDPADIDMIAYCNAGCYDYPSWSPSSRLQYTLGASRAYTIDLKGACNGGNLAISICNNLLKAEPLNKLALVVCSDKLSTVMDYQNQDTLPFFAIGDGAAAAVLLKDEPSNELLAYDGITDGTCGDYVKVPCISSHGIGSRISVNPAKALADISPDIFLGNFIRVIRNAVAKSGHQTPDISWLLTNQIKRTRVLDILSQLGLDERKTRSTMKEFGSIGPGDTLFALALQQEDHLVSPGDLVVLASSGIGFSWGAQVIRFR